ncbi:hypothetical protein [Paenibacillus harenae]|uniref:hypothetical protein n=1 Tax=Paenibacillus harenae TaxID=306543 RepID=UPI00278E9223|nr:hypothetical protein [Paenibacillus harenae]MDQ0062325.1 hypothetical protein [Paenibacillus harenae]
MYKLYFLCILSFILMITGCSTESPPPEATEEPIKIEHKYFSIGELVEGIGFNYMINSVKVNKDIPALDGHNWVVIDVTFDDTTGQEDEYTDYASMYGDFVLIDDEHNIYEPYNRQQKTEFYGSTRDYVLYLVPQSKSEFMLFEIGYFFESWSNFNDESRNIVNIKF